ncbi:hypothetical protein [Streptomyces sp. SP18BB07]|uniref:hypothetical protein n=1 Tax=Streptomyces sp. SP18BB07 TaxID=3002522 RepID=UPI002E7A2F24|nr:hypothetical protein [Streptomyces sp. SP18BB07]
MHGLTLADQVPGYSPLGAVYLRQRQSPAGMANSGWMFTTFSRYCPDRLAGTADLPSSPVWQGSWRLPHIFICSRNNRHLPWRCPACGAPAARPTSKWMVWESGHAQDLLWGGSLSVPRV